MATHRSTPALRRGSFRRTRIDGPRDQHRAAAAQPGERCRIRPRSCTRLDPAPLEMRDDASDHRRLGEGPQSGNSEEAVGSWVMFVGVPVPSASATKMSPFVPPDTAGPCV